MKEYLLGIDGGTEGIKAGLFDLDGNQIAISIFNYSTYYENLGWAEQKIEEWKEGLISSVNDVIEKAKIDPKNIVGIGHDATCSSVIFVDENNNPTRDPIIWMDVRAVKEAKLIESIDDSARRFNGYANVSPEWFPCKVLWVKENQPDVYKKSKIIAEYTDWITHELTGLWTTGISTAGARAYYDNRNKGWQQNFYKKMGLEDLFEKLPPKVLRVGELVGGLSKEFSENTGLREGTPVGQGAADAHCAVIGSNAFSSGQVFFIGGSGNYFQISIDKAFHKRGLFGSYPDVIIDNFTIEGGQTSSGSVLKWFITNFLNKQIENEAEKDKVSIYKYMDKMAKEIPVGSEGLIVLEHFQGNRTPFVDPNSRGLVRGLSLKHTPFHIYRAIMEASAYGTEATFRVLKESNFNMTEIIACGGHMNSDLWVQMYADVTGLPIKRTINPEAAVLGSGIVGGLASGRFNSLDEAAKKMVKFHEVVEPNMNNYKKYKIFVDNYIETYYAVKESVFNINNFIRKTEQNEKVL